MEYHVFFGELHAHPLFQIASRMHTRMRSLRICGDTNFSYQSRNCCFQAVGYMPGVSNTFVVAGGFKGFLISSLVREKIPSLTSIFQMGWNHQLVLFSFWEKSWAPQRFTPPQLAHDVGTLKKSHETPSRLTGLNGFGLVTAVFNGNK